MENKVRNLFIDQGATFSIALPVMEGNTAVNLSTWEVRGQMRKHYTSSVAYDFTVTGTNTGIIISMLAEDTALVPPGRYVYDIEAALGATVHRVYQGLVTVDPEVTR